MQRKPSLLNKVTGKVQARLAKIIPEKVHQVVTTAIKQMVKGVLFGAKITTAAPEQGLSLEDREKAVMQRIKIYKTTAAAEGGITGAGGILLGLADFPLLVGIKLKLLFDIASLYGFQVKDFKERMYILYIFQLAFSSQQKRNEVYRHIASWKEICKTLPDDTEQFDWRSFQQEYRDYIDIAKMAQLVPVIGAPVGAIANYGLIKKLGTTAMNAYRMRWLQKDQNGAPEMIC
ncbi:MAG: EcsC family protein [Williamsia sp.]|nr:EcsC family protein [Williamsia sp.]